MLFYLSVRVEVDEPRCEVLLHMENSFIIDKNQLLMILGDYSLPFSINQMPKPRNKKAITDQLQTSIAVKLFSA